MDRLDGLLRRLHGVRRAVLAFLAARAGLHRLALRHHATVRHHASHGHHASIALLATGASLLGVGLCSLLDVCDARGHKRGESGRGAADVRPRPGV